MKKKIIALLALSLAIVGITACKPTNITPSYDSHLVYPEYGCPNSKRVKKLNTRKKRG